ncbi:hypothetical protein HanRHA438_Chr10g0460531 [Helianthus annuus]|nr:hypothetical protein HanRHA438_Chr10g0460531 [Helianthus annuus]
MNTLCENAMEPDSIKTQPLFMISTFWIGNDYLFLNNWVSGLSLPAWALRAA